jgi:hypothetical protein
MPIARSVRTAVFSKGVTTTLSRQRMDLATLIVAGTTGAMGFIFRRIIRALFIWIARILLPGMPSRSWNTPLSTFFLAMCFITPSLGLGHKPEEGAGNRRDVPGRRPAPLTTESALTTGSMSVMCFHQSSLLLPAPLVWNLRTQAG